MKVKIARKIQAKSNNPNKLLSTEPIPFITMEFDKLSFDFANPKAWYNFLSNYRTKDGKLLPRYTKDGDPILYQARLYGVSREVKEYLGLRSEGRLKWVMLFPKMIVLDDGSIKLFDEKRGIPIKFYGRLKE